MPDDAASAPTAPAPSQPADRRDITRRIAKPGAGCPPGTAHADKRTYEPAALASDLADSILSGKGVPIGSLARVGPLTENDRTTCLRITGKSAEEFQAMITARTQDVALLTIDLIKEKLTSEPDKQKLYELTGLFAVSMDKLAALSGRTGSAGNVSVQINNFGTLNRSELLSMAKGAINGTPHAHPPAIELTPSAG